MERETEEQRQVSAWQWPARRLAGVGAFASRSVGAIYPELTDHDPDDPALGEELAHLSPATTLIETPTPVLQELPLPAQRVPAPTYMPVITSIALVANAPAVKIADFRPNRLNIRFRRRGDAGTVYIGTSQAQAVIGYGMTLVTTAPDPFPLECSTEFWASADNNVVLEVIEVVSDSGETHVYPDLLR